MCSVSALSSPSLPWPQSTSWILPEARSFSLPGARPHTEMQQGVVWRSCLCEPLPQVQSFIYLDNWFICDCLSHFAGDSTWVGACLMVASVISEHPAVSLQQSRGSINGGKIKWWAGHGRGFPYSKHNGPQHICHPQSSLLHDLLGRSTVDDSVFSMYQTRLFLHHIYCYLSTPIILITTLWIDSYSPFSTPATTRPLDGCDHSWDLL